MPDSSLAAERRAKLMSILNSLVEQFSHEVRKRGTDYFVRGAVRIVDAKPGRVRAQVTGTRVYRVELDFDDDDFTNECSCPYYEQWGECKHIWATILQAEREGLLGEREFAPRENNGDNGAQSDDDAEDGD